MEINCHALLFSDYVITEKNGKNGLIGLFGAFNFPQFPVQAPRWFIYAYLSNITGKHEFSINLVRDESQHVVFPLGGELEISGEGNEIELVLQVPPLIFPKDGNHTLTLNLDGQQIASRILRVNQLPPSGGLR